MLLTAQTDFATVDNMLAEAQGVGEFLGEMRDRTFDPHEAFSVGEVFNEKDEELPDFIGDNGYFSSMFDFAPVVFRSKQQKAGMTVSQSLLMIISAAASTLRNVWATLASSQILLKITMNQEASATIFPEGEKSAFTAKKCLLSCILC